MSKKSTKQSRKTARRKAAQRERARVAGLRSKLKARGLLGVDNVSTEMIERRASTPRHAPISAGYRKSSGTLPFGAAGALLAAAATIHFAHTETK